VGDPGYMAPELLYGHFTAQSEVYAFGMVVLELLTGHKVDAGVRDFIGE